MKNGKNEIVSEYFYDSDDAIFGGQGNDLYHTNKNEGGDRKKTSSIGT